MVQLASTFLQYVENPDMQWQGCWANISPPPFKIIVRENCQKKKYFQMKPWWKHPTFPIYIHVPFNQLTYFRHKWDMFNKLLKWSRYLIFFNRTHTQSPNTKTNWAALPLAFMNLITPATHSVPDRKDINKEYERSIYKDMNRALCPAYR